MNSSAGIIDRLSALADATRSRILLVLDGHELTVGELCAVLQLPQSTVSRHLRSLADGGWIGSRGEGTSNLYTMNRSILHASNGHRAQPDDDARRLWLVVRDQVARTSAARQDERRLRAALSRRQTKSREFFASSAGQWDRLRAELFGERFHLAAFAALADRSWKVADLGCGTGQVAAALAPFVAHIIGVDGSEAMLQTARRRLQAFGNVDLRRGDLEALPIDDTSLDAATMMLVLHHVPEPPSVLAEAARVLSRGGRLIVVDMLQHDRENYRQQMGHVWLGFSEENVNSMLGSSGFVDVGIVPLPPDPNARGPELFVATARRSRRLKSFIASTTRSV